MTTITFTEFDVALIAEIRKIAAEQPDYVYTPHAEGRCLYQPDEQNPNGCIAGYAMRRLGHSVDTERVLAIDAILRASAWLPETTPEARAWVRAVQAAQDVGRPWGAAVTETDLTYPRMAKVGLVDEDGAA